MNSRALFAFASAMLGAGCIDQPTDPLCWIEIRTDPPPISVGTVDLWFMLHDAEASPLTPCPSSYEAPHSASRP